MAYSEFDTIYWDVDGTENTGKIVGMYIEDYKVENEDEPRRATVQEPAYIVEMDDQRRYIVDHCVINHDKSPKTED